MRHKSLALALAALHRKTQAEAGGVRTPAEKRDQDISGLVRVWMRRYGLRRRPLKSIFPVEK